MELSGEPAASITIVHPAHDAARRGTLGGPQPERQLPSGTHVVLGEAGNVAGDGLEPVQTVLSCRKLDDSAAHSVHSDDLERVFPERGDEEGGPEGFG